MLRFNLLLGEDVYLGRRGQPDSYVQLLFKEIDREASPHHLVVFVGDEEQVEVVLHDDHPTPIGVFDTGLVCRGDPLDEDAIQVGFHADLDVHIVRGRLYRKEIQE